MAEAAGLALGVLSLLVSALETYDECASISKGWFRYEREFKRVARRIRRFDLQYRYSLKRLLRPVASDAEWQTITSDPWHPEWKEIEHRLRRRLPHDEFGTYFETIEDLASTMQQLQRKLLVEDDRSRGQQVSTMQVPQSKFNRFKFAFGERSREKILGEIEKLLAALDMLIVGHEHVTRMAWTSTSQATELSAAEHQFWRCAHLFHAAVVSALSCSCSPSYNGDLGLNYDDQLNAQPKVLLHRDQTEEALTGDHRPWSTLTMTVSFAELPRPATAQGQQSSSQSLQVIPTKKLSRLPFSKRRKYAIPSTSPVQSCTSQATSSTTSIAAASQQLLPVSNICKLIPEFNGIRQGRLDLPSDPQSFKSYINFIVQETPVAKTMTDVVVLAAWLQGAASDALRTTRLFIASKITWSYLPIPECQIPTNPCTAGDIIFLQASGQLDLAHPYLRRRHNKPRSSLSDTPSITTAFVRLGLTLIQLCFGNTLEDTPIGQPWPHTDFRPDDRIARQWSPHVELAVGPWYAGAVEWCLSEHTVVGDDLVTEYYREVIGPVKACYEWSSGRRGP